MAELITRESVRWEFPGEAIAAGAIYWRPTGSRYICEPPVLDTDEDWIVYVSGMVEFAATLGKAVPGFEEGESCCDCPDFVSIRLPGNINLIATDKHWFYRKYVIATEVAKRLNLRAKCDRILLFDSVIFGSKTSKWKSEPVPADLPDKEVAWLS